MFVTVIVFILIFSLLILIHELGHFTAAKKAGVKVEEFGFGLPPRAWGIKKGETLYSINWIPFGGFVRMLGEDLSNPQAAKSKMSFNNQSLWAQTVIVSGGVFMNFLLAFVLLTFGFLLGIEPLIANETDFFNAIQDDLVRVEIVDEALNPILLPRIRYFEAKEAEVYEDLQGGDLILAVNEKEIFSYEQLDEFFSAGLAISLEVYRQGVGNLEFEYFRAPYPSSESVLFPRMVISHIEDASPAADAALLVGDIITALGSEPFDSESDVLEFTDKYAEDGVISYEVMRGDTVLEFDIPLREDGRIGIGLSPINRDFDGFYSYIDLVEHDLLGVEKIQLTWEAPIMAVTEMWRLGKLTAVMFVQVLGNFVSGGDVPEGVAGPVGIAQMTHVFLQDGFAAMLRFVALLSLSLGVINILPIPALDGGRMVFIIYRAVTGKKPSARLEHGLHGIGFILLLLFIAYITFNDVLNLF